MSAFLQEAVDAAKPQKAGSAWRVVVATPGQGSSGFYSPELLKEFGPAAFPDGTKAYIDHDAKRSVRDIVGVWKNVRFSESDNWLEAELYPFKHWSELIEDMGEHLGASMYVSGDLDGDGNVTRLHEDRGNSIDLVSVSGLAGSGLKERIEQLAESAKAHEAANKPASAVLEENGSTMDEKVLAAVEKLTVLLESHLKTEADRAAKVEADAKSSQDAVAAFAESLKAIDDADLSPAQRRHILAEAANGIDVSARIAEAKEIKDEFTKQALHESHAGRVVISGGQDTDFSVSGWGK